MGNVMSFDKATQTLTLSRELTFSTVAELERQYAPLFNGKAAPQKIVVDLSKVLRSDSAGLALLIEWTRKTKRNHRELSFIHPPPQLRAMVELCGLNTVLPLHLST